LVVDSKDETIVKLRVQEFLKTLPSDKIVELLSVIYEGNVDLEQPIGTVGPNSEFLHGLLEMALDALLDRWSVDLGLIPKDALMLYYQMASISTKYRPAPPFQPTWDALRETFEENMSLSRSMGETEASGVEELLDFLEMVKIEDPRFLRYIDFPNCVSELLNLFIDISVKDAKSDKSFCVEDKELYEAYMYESHRLKDVAEVIERLNEVYKKPEGPCLDEASQIVSAASAKYEDMAKEYYVPEPDYEKPVSDDVGTTVDQIFSDL
jgi:hypothetical protein